MRKKVSALISENIDRDSGEFVSLSNENILKLCDLQMPSDQQAELSELLAQNRENQLTAEDHLRLETLMQIYRHGLVHKAEAIKVAVERGLRPPLS